MPPPPASNPAPDRAELLRLARVFLKLGATAFGGPAAHVALMEDELVRRRQWLTRPELLDLVSATHLIPGPNSTELALLIGLRRAGGPGLLVAGICFILPAALLVTAIAAAYSAYGRLPAVNGILAGVQPVIIAIVAQALWGFARTALKSGTHAALALAGAMLAVYGVHELIILFATGLILPAISRRARPSTSPDTHRLLPPPSFAAAIPGLGAAAASSTALVAVAPFQMATMFGLFLKTGAVLFGSGYVLLAFLRRDFVETRHWLTEAQLLDAVAVGQFTPGPVFTTATFIGYLLAGTPGAFVATLGIFLPAFLVVAVSGHLIPRLRESAVSAAFLDGVNVASLALMAVVTSQLARAAIVDGISVLTVVVAAYLLVRHRINSAWLIAAGAVLGLILPT